MNLNFKDLFYAFLFGMLFALFVAVFLAMSTGCTSSAHLPLFSSFDVLPIDLSKPPPIVRLHNKLTGAFFCSGTVISRHYVVTAAHCLVDKDRISVRSINNIEMGVAASVANFEPRSDQGLLYGDFSKFNASAIIYPTADNLNSWFNSKSLVSCGFPYGGEIFCIKVKLIRASFFHMATSGVLYPGMSGGPVFDVDKNVVIGVNSSVGDGEIYLSPINDIFSNLDIGVL